MLPKFSNVKEVEFPAAHSLNWRKMIIGQKAAQASQGYGICRSSAQNSKTKLLF
jgi:hypothetical protein